MRINIFFGKQKKKIMTQMNKKGRENKSIINEYKVIKLIETLNRKRTTIQTY